MRHAILVVLLNAVFAELSREEEKLCHFDANQCFHGVDHFFGEAYQLRLAGDYGKILHSPDLLQAYCKRDNWVAKSELCGGCQTTLHLTDVPNTSRNSRNRYLKNAEFCLSQYSLTNEVSIRHGLEHPGIGKELEMTTHSHTGDGCSPDDWPDMENKIAVVTYGNSGCADMDRFLVAASKGSRVGVVFFAFFHNLYENRPPTLTRTSENASSVHNLGMAVYFTFDDNQIFDHLAAEAASKSTGVLGVINDNSHCKTGEFIAPEEDEDFFDDPCPWWFMLAYDLCSSQEDERNRLCSYCQLSAEIPDSEVRDGDVLAQPALHEPCSDGASADLPTGEAQGKNLACLYAPDLTPSRKRNTLLSLFAPEETFKVVDVVFYYDPAEARREWFCSLDEVAIMESRHGWDAASTIIVFVAPSGMRSHCQRITPLENLQSYARGSILLDEVRLQGVAREALNFSTGTTVGVQGSDSMIRHLSQEKFRVDEFTFKATLNLTLGSPGEAKVVVTRPPPFDLPQAEMTDEGILYEDGSVASLVLIPLMLTAIITKFYLDVRARPGEDFASPDTDSNVEIPGVPLVMGSTALSLTLLVGVAALSFGLCYAAGRNGIDDASGDAEEAVSFTNLMNEQNVLLLTQNLMEQLTENAILTFHNWKMKALYSATMHHGVFQTLEPNTTYSTFVEQIRSTQLILRNSMVEAWPEMQWRFQVYKVNGFYFDQWLNMNEWNQTDINKTNRGYLYDFYSSKNNRVIPRSLWDPFSKVNTAELPEGYCNILAYFFAVDNGYRTNLGHLYYRVHSHEDAPLQRGFGPMLSILSPIRKLPEESTLSHGDSSGLIVLSRPAQQLSSEVMEGLRRRIASPAFAHLSLLFFDVEGVLFATSGAPYKALDHFPGKRTTSLLPTVTHSDKPHVNGLAHYLLKTYGTLVPNVLQRDRSLNIEFDQKEYFKPVKSEIIQLSFEANILDSSGETWDVRLVNESGDTVEAVFGSRGVNGTLRLDGSRHVLIYTYLTTRTPRVQETRVMSASTWESTQMYYNTTGEVDGISDVILGEEIPGSGDFSAVVREVFHIGSAYTVCMWYRPEELHKYNSSVPYDMTPQLFTENVGGDAKVRVLPDGTFHISAREFGCSVQSAFAHVVVGEWNHIAAGMDFTAKTCYVVLNGEERGRGILSLLAEFEFDSEETTYFVGYKFVGEIDEVRVFNRTMSAADVDSLLSGHGPFHVESQSWTASLLVREEVEGIPGTSHVVMVPTQDIIKEVMDNSAHMTRLVQINKENSESKHARKSVETVLVTLVIWLVAALVYLIFNEMMTKPFVTFAHDINQIAMMELEKIDVEDFPVSLLKEINMMRRAMRVLIRNMREYKSFMPMSVVGYLNHTNRPEQEETLDDMSSCSETEIELELPPPPVNPVAPPGVAATPPSAPLPPALTLHNRPRMPRAHRRRTSNVAVLLASALTRKRRMSFVVVNIVDFHSLCETMSDQAIVTTHCDYITKVMSSCQRHKGLPDTFSGDRILLTFNGIRPCAAQHAMCAAQTGAELSRSWVVNQAVTLSMSVVSGSVRAGHIGAMRMRRYCMIGPVVPWAFALERFCRAHGCTLLANFRVVENCKDRMRFKHTIPISYAKMGPRLQLVSQIVEPEPGEEEFVFLDTSVDPRQRWNELLVLLATERLAAAAEHLTLHIEEINTKVHTNAETNLLKAVEQQHFRPPEIPYC